MKFLLPILLLISCHCAAQGNPCGDIKMQEQRQAGTVSYHAPLVGKETILSIGKDQDDTVSTYSFYIGIILPDPVHDLSGAHIKLADGTEISMEDAQFHCDAIDESKYNLHASFELDDAQIESLIGSPITSVTAGGIRRRVRGEDAARLMMYAQCLQEH